MTETEQAKLSKYNLVFDEEYSFVHVSIPGWINTNPLSGLWNKSDNLFETGPLFTGHEELTEMKSGPSSAWIISIGRCLHSLLS